MDWSHHTDITRGYNYYAVRITFSLDKNLAICYSQNSIVNTQGRVIMDIWTVLNALLASIGFYETNGHGWERDYNNSVKRLFRKFSQGIGYCLQIEACGEDLLVSLSSVGSVSLIPIGRDHLTEGKLAYWLEWMIAEFEAGRLDALLVEEERRDAVRHAETLRLEAEQGVRAERQWWLNFRIALAQKNQAIIHATDTEDTPPTTGADPNDTPKYINAYRPLRGLKVRAQGCSSPPVSLNVTLPSLTTRYGLSYLFPKFRSRCRGIAAQTREVAING